MIWPLAVLAGIAAFPQEVIPPVDPPTTLPPVDIVALPTEGEVTLRCVAKSDGHLTDCIILSERPAGAGFGEEALRSARQAKLAPRTVRGAPENASVQFTVRFRMAP